jgi:hypothetical protein
MLAAVANVWTSSDTIAVVTVLALFNIAAVAGAFWIATFDRVGDVQAAPSASAATVIEATPPAAAATVIGEQARTAVAVPRPAHLAPRRPSGVARSGHPNVQPQSVPDAEETVPMIPAVEHEQSHSTDPQTP